MNTTVSHLRQALKSADDATVATVRELQTVRAQRAQAWALLRELLANLDAEPFVGVFLGDVEDRIRAALPADPTKGEYHGD